MTALPSAPARAPWLPAALRLAIPGLIGVAALFPSVRGLVASMLEQPALRARVPAGLSLDVVAAVNLIQPAVLTVGSVLLGLVLAPRVGLRSVLAGHAARLSGADVRAGVATGIVTAGLLLALDAVTRPLLGAAGGTLNLLQRPTLSGTLAGVLYGGITEELLLRFGLMTLLVWIGWRLGQRDRGTPRPGVMWAAVVLSAVLFGLGHLGAAGSMVALTPAVVIRTVALNAVVGVAFGWLYWRRNLETAMIAHAGWHVSVALAGLLVASG